MTALETVAKHLGPNGLKTLADDLSMLNGFGSVLLVMHNGRLDHTEATRSTKPGTKAQLRVIEEEAS